MKTKLFPFDFVGDHSDCKSAVAYRFSFRVKMPDGMRSPDVRIAFRVGAPADIQSYAEMLSQDENVLNAAAEYLYTVEFDKLSRITPIKSENFVAEIDDDDSSSSEED